MQSLLGQFYNRIRGSQEDLASEGLVYILQQSPTSRQVIQQLVRASTSLQFSNLSFQTQTVGNNLERPDISGIDEQGIEVLLMEAKFWAALTRNQPNGYLKRLGKDTVLLFLVPTLRTRTIFEEVKVRVLEEYEEVVMELDQLSLFLPTTQQHVVIKSWNEVLSALKIDLEQQQQPQLLSDLNQIIGLCATIDRNAFQPITEEDLSPKIPKSINSYYEVVDKVVNVLKTRSHNFSTKGLLKTAQRYGYHRYFATPELALNFALKLDLWQQCADTPFWLGIDTILKTATWDATNLKRSIKHLCLEQSRTLIPYSNNKGFFIGLRPLLYQTEEVVIRDLADQIETFVNRLLAGTVA